MQAQTSKRGTMTTPIRLALATLLALAPLSAAHADSVRISGLWIDNVTIESVVDGQIAFRPSGGSLVEQPLSKLEGIKLDRVPQFAEAEQALEDDEPAEAAAKLRAAIEEARQPWAKQIGRKRLVGALGAAGEPVAAVQAYIELAQGEHVDAALLDPPPVDVVRGADDAAKQRIARVVDQAMNRAAESARAHFEQLRGATEQDAAAGDDAGESAVVLPAGIDDDVATQALRDGDFEAALQAADQALSSSGGLSRAFYQKGKAQLALAEQSDDLDGYKSAGLSFMRSVVYFPRSRYVGPALVEAGYVHAKIGRPDLARTLYDRARIQIDEEEDAAYHQRLMTLIQQLDENE